MKHKALEDFFKGLTLRQLGMLAVVLCAIAFLPNLGRVAFIGDEAIRTLVAFEMDLSGNFMVPTLNGEAYYNKPPLYNWFIFLMSKAFGYYGEWPTRMTTLLSLGIFALIVFHHVRRHVNTLTGVTMALMVLTSGRILFWDSMLGLIDICFSAVVYFNFMILYGYGREKKWLRFFVLSYFLFAIAFLLKGLPAVVFQALSIPTALYLHGALKTKFFSREHTLGLLAGAAPLLLYYIPYATQVPLDKVFSVLLDQSMQRTATHHGLLESVRHVFTFPPEQVYHFLPWSLLVIVAFHPSFRTWLRSDPFIQFNFWLLVINLPVYWLSVQVYPRYLLMFIPLFNLVGYAGFKQLFATGAGWRNSLHYFFLGVAGLMCMAIWVLPLIPGTSGVPWLHMTWLVGGLAILFCAFGLAYDRGRVFIWMALCLLVLRFVFSMVVLPIRSAEFRENTTRESCRRVAAAHGDRTWYLYGETFPHEVARFYTSGFAGQQIKKTSRVTDLQAYYLVDPALYPDFQGIKVDSIILERGQILPLMKARGSE